MSQRLLYHAFGVREGYKYWRTEYADGCIRFFLLVKPEWLVCSRCQSREVSRKGRRFRELQTVPIGFKPVFLVTEGPQCACRNCGRSFEAPPFAPAYVTYTHRLRALIEDLRSVLTVADLAAVTGLSGDTVKNIIPKRLEKDYGRPRLRNLQPLSIDEIYLGRRKWFGTLVMDLDTGRIVWAAQGRGANALRKFWPARRSSRAKIEAVAMDMSAAYWAAVAENLPTAAIVFDRFHTTKPAVVELAYPFRVERIPAADGNYWRDLHVPGAQFEFPFVTTEDGQRGSRAGEPFLPGPVLDFRHTAPATPPTGMSHDLWSNVPVASESAVTVPAQETTVSRCDPARQPEVG